MSGIYLDICKDRLYCDDINSARRRSAQSVMVIITRSLLPLIAPTLTYTVDEVMEFAPDIIKNGKSDAFDLLYEELDYDFKIEDEIFISSREKFFEMVDSLKKDKIIKSTLEIALETSSNEVLSHDMQDIIDWYLVSEVRGLESGECLAEFKVDDEIFRIVKSNLHKCPRCWKFNAQKEDELCPRCNKVMKNV